MLDCLQGQFGERPGSLIFMFVPRSVPVVTPSHTGESLGTIEFRTIGRRATGANLHRDGWRRLATASFVQRLNGIHTPPSHS